MTSDRLSVPDNIYVDTSVLTGAGRGVFAKERIPAGTLIEQCPVVALPDKRDRDRLRKTGLVNYYFLWGEKRDCAAICLGWGAVYNHSFEPNARYEKVMDHLRMDFTALRDIEAGEEILVNYNGAPDDRRPLRMPGIPSEAGGMPKATLPYPLGGLVRRAKLLSAWVSGKSSGFAFVLVAAGY